MRCSNSFLPWVESLGPSGQWSVALEGPGQPLASEVVRPRKSMCLVSGTFASICCSQMVRKLPWISKSEWESWGGGSGMCQVAGSQRRLRGRFT